MYFKVHSNPFPSYKLIAYFHNFSNKKRILYAIYIYTYLEIPFDLWHEKYIQNECFGHDNN